MPFSTRRFIMQMAVRYFCNSDFRFTFPIKFKFNFIDFAFHLLLKKEKSIVTRYISSVPSNPGFTRLLQIKQSISYKKKQCGLSNQQAILCFEVRTNAYTINLNKVAILPSYPAGYVAETGFCLTAKK